jgi:hypothetical protein
LAFDAPASAGAKLCQNLLSRTVSDCVDYIPETGMLAEDCHIAGIGWPQPRVVGSLGRRRFWLLLVAVLACL